MRLEALSSQELDNIDGATRKLLSTTGIKVDSENAREIFASAGAVVDHGTENVKIPSALLDRTIDTLPRHFTLWYRDGSGSINLQDGTVRGHNVGGAVKILDRQTMQPRDANREDLEITTRLIDALPNIHICRPVVYPAEFPPPIRDIHTAACMLQYTIKPYGVSAYSLDNLAYILQLASCVAGSFEDFIQRPFIWGSVCPDSPLHYTRSTTEILMKYAEIGLPVAIAPCPIAGGTSPVTLAGTLVLQNAEFLTGLVLVQLINPGNPIKCTTRPIPMEMRTGTASFGSVELGMMSAVIAQLSRRIGVCSDVYGLGTSSKTLDEQTAFEKSINGLLPALAGADLIASAGMLEEALTTSYDQLAIDDEILGMIFRVVRGFEVSEETMALEVIHQAGPGGNFLIDAHTLAHARKEYHVPRLSYRTGSSSWSKGGYLTIMDAARDKVDRLLASSRENELSQSKMDEVSEILKQADRHLGHVMKD